MDVVTVVDVVVAVVDERVRVRVCVLVAVVAVVVLVRTAGVVLANAVAVDVCADVVGAVPPRHHDVAGLDSSLKSQSLNVLRSAPFGVGYMFPCCALLPVTENK